MVGRHILFELKSVVAFDCCGVPRLALAADFALKVLAKAACEGALLLLNFDVQIVDGHRRSSSLDRF